METKITPQQQRKRKFLLVLPLLVLPFLALAFWSLGGGKQSAVAAATPTEKTSRLNMELPDATFKQQKQAMDKLKFYEQADKDSAKLKSFEKSDPYYNAPAGPSDYSVDYLQVEEETPPYIKRRSGRGSASTRSVQTYSDPNEEKVMKKLEQLSRIMEQQEEEMTSARPYGTASTLPAKDYDGESARLQSLLQQLKADEAEKDPQLEQLESMLDKILDIQHPDRLAGKNSAEEVVPVEKAFAVSGKKDTDVNLLDPPATNLSVRSTAADREPTGFFGLEETITGASAPVPQNAIAVVIHEDQVLVNGATIKLRLEQPITAGAYTLPAGLLVFGTVSLSGERLLVAIKSLRSGNNILPVRLRAFDLDGVEGIYIPGSISREVAKQATGNAVQSIDMMTTLNPSLTAQAASAGIQTVKNLIGRKTKLIKVTVKAGHRLLLKDNDNTPNNFLSP